MKKNKRLLSYIPYPILMFMVIIIYFGFNLWPAMAEEDTVVIGLNYPETGPYAKQGLDQRRAADLAVEEINAAGGILGKKIKLVYKDTKTNTRISKQNAIELFDKEGAQMIFGGASSIEAVSSGRVAKAKNKLFFATLTYSPEVTGEEGNKYIFRECSDFRMMVRELSDYLNQHFGDKTYFYITADYSWGWNTEELLRKYSGSDTKEKHKGHLCQFGAEDYKDALNLAQEANPEVLVLILFGRDMEIALKQVYEMGLNKKMRIVVPSMTIDMAEGAGPEAMEGIITTTPWYWKLPFEANYPQGIAFVKKFEEKYKRYPTSSGASAYVILYQYKEAVERAKTFETMSVIKALENHSYIGVKDGQQWRDWDHQSIQTVYIVKCKKPEEVKKDKYQLDYYEVVKKIDGQDAAIVKAEWDALRASIGLTPQLEE